MVPTYSTKWSDRSVRFIDTALIFYHSRGCALKPDHGLTWLASKWLGCTIQDRGLGKHNPEGDARAVWIGKNYKKLRVVRTSPAERESWLTAEIRTEYEPILARIACSQLHSHSGGLARTAIVDHGNPGA
jgi:hypothetical protein